MWKAMIGLMIMATIGPMIIAKFDYYIEDLKTSRNGSSHEANVKESSYENFPLLWRMDRVNVYTELLELELDRPLAVKWKNSRKWPDTLPQVDKLLAHINGWPDLKPYNMFGTTAFRSQPHWGDNGGEKHILPGEDIMDEPCPLSEAAEANERFCCTIRRAPKSHPRAVRQHDLWSHGWQMNMYTLLIIKEITSSSILHETLVLVSLFCIFQITRLANELVKIVDKLLAKLWALIGNGGTELKAYKKSRITHPGKHGHNVGSTAFRNWAQGGDGSDEELTIQDDWGSPSVQMTSPAPKTTPQTPPPPTPPPSQTPPSPTLRATPQVQPPTPTPQVQPPTPTPQVQPPTPTPQVQPRTPTPAPPPPPPPPPRGWFNFNFGGWFNFNFGGWFNFNVAGLAKIFLTISATLVLAPPQIVLSGGQDNTAAKLLIALGVLANVFGLLLLVALGK
ncbi:hypothetical protein AB3S75_022830 [Citrus x aurantiifolia]